MTGARSQPLLTASSAVKKAPSWSMRGRTPSRDSLPTKGPGPGSYGLPSPDKSKVPRAPAAQFGTSTRDGFVSSKQAPGPGQYTPKVSGLSLKFGFGTSVRVGEGGRRSRTPGPGAYNLRSEPGGMKISFTARTAADRARSQGPGPGSYTPSLGHLDGQPKFGFGTALRPEVTKGQKGPGPGTYATGNTLGMGAVTLPHAPKYSMKPRRNPAIPGANTPGPAANFTQFGA